LRSRLLRVAERDTTHIQVNRSLRDEFAAKLAGWDWDIALLQEAPPRWLADLERATGAVGARDLTSRNSVPALRARLAEWNPDLVGSNEGGSNMLLVRPPARIVATTSAVLATRPERRVLSLARVLLPETAGSLAERFPSGARDPAVSGPQRRLTIANMHLSVPSTGQGRGEALRAAALATDRAGRDPLIFGGDLNLRLADHRAAFDDLRDRFGLAGPTGPRAIDHLLARSLDVVAPPAALPAAEREVPGPGGLAIRLSDHAPVVASFGLR
jgi:endonuclease/exonuclease/phosphatase family metal-dependent hydrolase